MKLETLAEIFIGAFVIVGLISLIIILSSEKHQHIGEKLGRFSLFSIAVIFGILTFPRNAPHYSLYSAMGTWEELGVPQIDSCMYLSKMSRRGSEYLSLSKDSIRHSSKVIDYDLFFIYKIEDEFDNYHDDLHLCMIYIKPGLLNKEQRINILSGSALGIDTLSEQQTDSLLKAWGFGPDLYEANHRY